MSRSPDPVAAPARFTFPVVPRYAEVDQQGVVFFGHYLTWFDEAFAGFLAHSGLPYPELIAGGLDVQIVHSEVDYRESVRWGDDVRIAVALEKVGTTSLATTYAVHRTPETAEPAVVGRLVHVCVGTDDWTKRPVPESLRAG